jgi:aerobic carbon-monoxide dehydrogenase medium subunit
VIPAAFEYTRAGSVDEAVALLAGDDDAKLLAGGHSLIPAMRLRFSRPSLLIDIGRLDDLRYVREDGDRIAIGALTRHAALVRDPVLAQHCALIGQTASHIGDPQVRHRGTIGGSVAHGDPASDLPAALLALDATFVVRGPGGAREIPAADFFRGFLETALEPDELLTEIRVPKTGPNGFAFEKFNRRAQDFATVGVVAARTNGATRVALINMGSTPLRAGGVEAALAEGATPADAAAHAAEGTEPASDLNATPEYREHLARVLVRRALEAI